MLCLIDSLKNPIGKKEVERLATLTDKGTFSVKDLIDLSFNENKQIGFRSAWILENIYSNHRVTFIPQIHYFFQKFSHQTNLSALRHYVKILNAMTREKASQEIRTIIEEHKTEEFVDLVFDWLIEEKTPVAVKSHCLDILANLNRKHSWIKDELLATMDYLVDKERIAFFAKVRQIRKKLS